MWVWYCVLGVACFVGLFTIVFCVFGSFVGDLRAFQRKQLYCNIMGLV